MDRSSKAVISQVLAAGITPLLNRHGFDRNGRTYYRSRDGRLELVNIQPHKYCNRFGGSFAVNLGIFVPEVDAAVSLYPKQERPEDHECHIRDRIDGWYEFDAHTDLAALGAEASERVEREGLGFFERMSDRAELLAWVRRVHGGEREIALAAHLGELALAQEWLDRLAASGWIGPNRTLRRAARLAGRLGLRSPAATDSPALTAVFRLAGCTPVRDRAGAFHHLDYKLDQYNGLMRDVLSVPALYHTIECTDLTATVTYYGAEHAQLLGQLRRAFAKLSELFEEITVTT